MSRRRKTILGTFAAVVVVAASSVGVMRVMFERRLSGEVDELLAASQGPAPTVVTEAELSGLPEPVQRWLRHAQVVGKQRPATVRLKMEGQFRLAEDKGWMPFEAEEYYTTDPPGFIWTVSMEMAPLVSIVGRDRYSKGKGGIDMRLLGAIPVARASGGDLDQGSMLRYLNEIMFFPAAALQPYITWTGIDASSALATMNYGGVTASATFVFDELGQLTTMTAERNNDAKGRPMPWSTPLGEYGEFEGVRVPIAGEAVWRYESSDFSYIRLLVTEIGYNQPSRF